eukprot:6367776-Prymnesium_polylepis.1
MSESSLPTGAGLGAGTPVLDSAWAPGESTPAVLCFEAQKLLALSAVAKNLGWIGSERSAYNTPGEELQIGSVERRSQSARRLPCDPSPNTVQLSDDAEDAGRDSESQGHTALPSKPELIEVLRGMVVGGEVTPRRSPYNWKVESADNELAVLVVDA